MFHQVEALSLTPVQTSADDGNLPEALDVVLAVDTIHIGNQTQYLTKLKLPLRPEGWPCDFKADSPSGPRVQHRISRVTEELKSAPGISSAADCECRQVRIGS